MPPSPTVSPASLGRLPRPAARLLATLAAGSALFALIAPNWHSEASSLVPRLYGPALLSLAVFSALECWPHRLPHALPRWALQVVFATLSVPLAEIALYIGTTPDGAPAFWDVPLRLQGFLVLVTLGTLAASWMAMGALVRQREGLVRQRDAEALQAERERGELERQALDARLRLLQAQVEPHFLFNTLANVQALVDAGSPQASPVLASLVAYLRAAVPRLSEPQGRLGQELEMVRAYLDLMRLRLPDRLQFAVEAERGTDVLRCPPMTLMTLVENAVKHGIDPSLEGGRIDVRVRLLPEGRCLAEVADTGLGLQPTSRGLGTGLSTLRERLRLAFGDAAALRLVERAPHGVLVQVEFPCEIQ